MCRGVISGGDNIVIVVGVLSFCCRWPSERTAIDRDCVFATLHEVFIGKFIARCMIVNFEVSVLGHGLPQALREDLPISTAFVSVIIQHPMRRCEVGHDDESQVMEAKRAQEHDKTWPERNRVIHWHHVSISTLEVDGLDSSHTCERSTLELHQALAIGSSTLGKNACRVIGLVVHLNGSLAITYLLNSTITGALVGSSCDEEALKTSACCAKQWHGDVFCLRSESRMQR